MALKKPNSKNKQILPAGKFKDQCLALMDELQKNGGEIVITKRGIEVARLLPITVKKTSEKFFGCLEGTVKAQDAELLTPTRLKWEAEE